MVSALLAAILLPSVASADVLLSTGITDRELAEHYAPVLYQDVADGLFNDPQNYRRDFITRVDFDGDFDATNNIENLNSGVYPLLAFVYFDVVETPWHYYIAYSFFHPTTGTSWISQTTRTTWRASASWSRNSAARSGASC